jgi:hypothetical protein
MCCIRTVKTQLLYLMLFTYLSSLHVSALVRPSSGSLEVCLVHCFLTFYSYIYTINYTAIRDVLYYCYKLIFGSSVQQLCFDGKYKTL